MGRVGWYLITRDPDGERWSESISGLALAPDRGLVLVLPLGLEAAVPLCR